MFHKLCVLAFFIAVVSSASSYDENQLGYVTRGYPQEDDEARSKGLRGVKGGSRRVFGTNSESNLRHDFTGRFGHTDRRTTLHSDDFFASRDHGIAGSRQNVGNFRQIPDRDYGIMGEPSQRRFIPRVTTLPTINRNQGWNRGNLGSDSHTTDVGARVGTNQELSPTNLEPGLPATNRNRFGHTNWNRGNVRTDGTEHYRSTQERNLEPGISTIKTKPREGSAYSGSYTGNVRTNAPETPGRDERFWHNQGRGHGRFGSSALDVGGYREDDSGVDVPIRGVKTSKSSRN